jgi:hypothetical protein
MLHTWNRPAARLGVNLCTTRNVTVLATVEGSSVLHTHWCSALWYSLNKQFARIKSTKGAYFLWTHVFTQRPTSPRALERECRNKQREVEGKYWERRWKGQIIRNWHPHLCGFPTMWQTIGVSLTEWWTRRELQIKKSPSAYFPSKSFLLALQFVQYTKCLRSCVVLTGLQLVHMASQF